MGSEMCIRDSNYPKEDAESLIEEICQKAKDTEVKDRLRTVEDTYSRADKTNIAYRTWLREAGIKGEEYERLIFQLLDIIKGSFIIGNGKLAVRKSYNTLIITDFNKCTIKELRVRKDNSVVLSDTIAMAAPCKVVVIQTEDSEVLKVSFKTPEGFILTFEGDIEEISNQLKKNTVRATSRRKIEDALSLIISRMIQIGWCEVVRGESVKGLVLNDGKVIAIDYDISVPDPATLREALETLNKFVEMSKFSQDRLGKIAKVVKWFAVSALGWIYKQLGYWIPHLYLYGESDTGKSKTAQFLCNIWEEQPSLSLGSIDSPYRLGLALSHTTFPIIVNEMDFEVLDPEVLELWKNAVDGQTLRTRYGRKVKAYGVFCFTSNTSIPSSKAIQKRLVIIHFDPKDAEVLKKNEKDFEKLEVERKKLTPIGQFIANWVNAHIEDLKRLPWESLAEAALKAAYEYAGLEVPGWLTMTDVEELDEDTKASKAEEIRAFIFTKLTPYIKERFEEHEAYVLFSEVSKKIPWIVYRPRENDVVLLKPLLKELKREDIKVSSLKDLVYYIPDSEYKAKLKVEGRVLSGVTVDPAKFGKWLGFVISEESDESALEDEVLENVRQFEELFDEFEEG